MSGTFGGAPFGSVPFGGGTVTDYWYENNVSPEERLRGQREQPPPLGVADLKAHYLAQASPTTTRQSCRREIPARSAQAAKMVLHL
jgi:hypothetical protein